MQTSPWSADKSSLKKYPATAVCQIHVKKQGLAKQDNCNNMFEVTSVFKDELKPTCKSWSL